MLQCKSTWKEPGCWCMVAKDWSRNEVCGYRPHCWLKFCRLARWFVNVGGYVISYDAVTIFLLYLYAISAHFPYYFRSLPWQSFYFPLALSLRSSNITKKYHHNITYEHFKEFPLPVWFQEAIMMIRIVVIVLVPGEIKIVILFLV